jgi:hypothetical protein
MNIIFSFFILSLFLIYIIYKIVQNIKLKKKSKIFFDKYFNEDKLYSLTEVSNAFKLDENHFHSLIKTLQTYKYFSFFNRRGVDMIKDYYSQYELKFLIKIISKKQNLKI